MEAGSGASGQDKASCRDGGRADRQKRRDRGKFGGRGALMVEHLTDLAGLVRRLRRERPGLLFDLRGGAYNVRFVPILWRILCPCNARW